MRELSNLLIQITIFLMLITKPVDLLKCFRCFNCKVPNINIEKCVNDTSTSHTAEENQPRCAVCFFLLIYYKYFLSNFIGNVLTENIKY